MTDPLIAQDDDGFDLDAELVELGLSLEELDRQAESLEGVFDRALAEVLDPPAGFEQRMARRAARRLHDRQSLFAFGGLMGLAWETARVIVEGDDDVRR